MNTAFPSMLVFVAELIDEHLSAAVDARPAWEHPDFDWGAICIWDLFDAVGYTEYAEIVLPKIFKDPNDNTDFSSSRDANAHDVQHAQRWISIRLVHDFPLL